jgi:hypothetical protein
MKENGSLEPGGGLRNCGLRGMPLDRVGSTAKKRRMSSHTPVDWTVYFCSGVLAKHPTELWSEEVENPHCGGYILLRRPCGSLPAQLWRLPALTLFWSQYGSSGLFEGLWCFWELDIKLLEEEESS